MAAPACLSLCLRRSSAPSWTLTSLRFAWFLRPWLDDRRRVILERCTYDFLGIVAQKYVGLLLRCYRARGEGVSARKFLRPHDCAGWHEITPHRQKWKANHIYVPFDR